MQEVKTISTTEFLENSCAQFGDRKLFSILTLRADGTPFVDSISGFEFLQKTKEIQIRHQVAGIQSSSRVAFLGESSVEWLEHFFASLLSGSTVCPLDIKWTNHEIDKVLAHFQGTHLLVSDSWWDKALQFSVVQEHHLKLIKFSDFAEYPEAFLQGLRTEKPAQAAKNSDLVLYTSGSTGTPKGVILPLSAVFFEAQVLSLAFENPPVEQRVIFSLLPLNHIYGLSSGVFVTMCAGYELCLSQTVVPSHIQQILRERKVRRFFTIPLFLNLIKNSVEAKVKIQPFLKRQVFKFTLALNRKLRSVFIARLFFKPIREALSDHLQYFVSGGAPLDIKTASFFDAIGWPVYNGYGLTETGPVISVNRESHNKAGSVGQVLPGVEVKIVPGNDNEDPSVGEILVKGANVFTGYYADPGLTAEAKDAEGWFKTGDLGRIDADGYLSIVGRRKSLIVLSSGKKVQPEEVEEILEQNPQIKATCLVMTKNKNTELLVAIIELREAISNPELINDLKVELKTRCESLAAYKRPQEFRIRTRPFEMTSSQKVKRHLVQLEVEKGLI